MYIERTKIVAFKFVNYLQPVGNLTKTDFQYSIFYIMPPNPTQSLKNNEQIIWPN